MRKNNLNLKGARRDNLVNRFACCSNALSPKCPNLVKSAKVGYSISNFRSSTYLLWSDPWQSESRKSFSKRN